MSVKISSLAGKLSLRSDQARGKIQCLLFAAKCILFKDKLLGDQIKLDSPRAGPENIWSKLVSTRFGSFFGGSTTAPPKASWPMRTPFANPVSSV
jgi:hypothetical protein